MAKKGWIKLKNLRPGAIFETKDGMKYFKAADEEKGKPFVFSLKSGFCSLLPKVGDELVKEVPTTNLLSVYWFAHLMGALAVAKLSDEDKAKLDTLTKKFLDGIKL